MFTLLLPLVVHLVDHVQGLCGESIRWSHRVNMDDVYGVWYGVGYAQHHPDMTNRPNEIGCVTLYISDASDEFQDNWLDWSILRRNYTDQSWRSSKSNPWSSNSMSGSWLDVRLERRVKRQYNGQYKDDEKRVRVLWDEDGHSIENVYLYYPEEPGLWTEEKLRPMEKEFMSRGIEIWYPDDPPRHPDVIRLLKVSPNILILNHCSEVGSGGIFTLILRRSPSRVQRWEWYKYQQEFYKFELPSVHRQAAVCDGCMEKISVFFIFVCISSLLLL